MGTRDGSKPTESPINKTGRDSAQAPGGTQRRGEHQERERRRWDETDAEVRENRTAPGLPQASKRPKGPRDRSQKDRGRGAHQDNRRKKRGYKAGRQGGEEQRKARIHADGTQTNTVDREKRRRSDAHRNGAQSPKGEQERARRGVETGARHVGGGRGPRTEAGTEDKNEGKTGGRLWARRAGSGRRREQALQAGAKRRKRAVESKSKRGESSAKDGREKADKRSGKEDEEGGV